MANSKLLLYVSNLTPEKNALISNPIVTADSNRLFEREDTPFVITFGTSMGWFQKTVASGRENDYLLIPEFTYIKHDLDVKIKVVLNQEDRLSKNVKAYNYVLIQNTDEACYGYFITDKKWISEHCVEYTLRMDVLNSYSTQIQNDRNTFSDTSYIYRAHQDRFNMDKTHYIPADHSEILYRYVNDVSEGLESPKLIQTNKETIVETIAPDEKWYLIYRSSDSSNDGVECFAVPENDTPFDEGGANITINKATLEGGAYVFMALDDNDGVTVNFTEHYPVEGAQRSYTVNSSTIVAVASRSSGDYLTIYLGTIDSDNSHISWNTGTWSENSATVTAPHGYRRVTSQSWGSGSSIGSDLDNIYQIQHDYPFIINAFGPLIYAYGIDSWDRTDSKLLKIIELPYAPFTLYKINNHYSVPANFTFINNRLKLTDLNVELKNDLSAKSLLNIMYFTDSAAITHPRYAKVKNIKYESKLLNSDFRGDKYVYDSYISPVRYEAMRESVGSIPYNTVTFYPSTNIASNLLFDIKYGSGLLGGYQYNKLEDYEGILVSTRNNEYPIYTNEYLNYIKTGYNYDKKTKDQQQIASGISLGISAATLIAGIALSGATGGSSLALGVSGAIGLAGSTMNAVNQSISAERSLDQKLSELKSRSASVANADDLSLLNVYNGNKLQWLQYEPSEQVKNSLWSMFHLTGYAYNKEGNIRDFLYSRRCFNFIQADLKDGLRSAAIPTDEIKDEIKNKFKEGVTVYHIFYNGTSEIIDWSKEYENFENYICPAKQPIIIG